MSTSTPIGALPIACNLSALDPQQRARHAELWKQARAVTPEAVATDHGIAFQFAASTDFAHTLTELASLERLCCPFLKISVSFEPAKGPLTLELSGGEEVHAFLSGSFLPA